MLYDFSEEELRSICKTHIESFEKWARFIIDQKLTDKYGGDYFNATNENGDNVIKKAIRGKAKKLRLEQPDRFKREIDTLFLEEIVDIICKDSLYNTFFRIILGPFYSSNGPNFIRHFLNKLIPIRNKLSHAHPVSIHAAEQCVCYCNDFIEAVKTYFDSKGQEKMFNVPNAIKVQDSLGNEYYPSNNKSLPVIRVLEADTGELRIFHVGDVYSVWVTMDPSFSPQEYIIKWEIIGVGSVGDGEKAIISIDERMIGESVSIRCKIISKKSWHKYNGFDQRFSLKIQIVPPKE